MRINLTPSQSKLIDRLIRTEGYETADEVIRAGLQLLARQAKRRTPPQNTKAKIAAGLRDVEAGRLVSGEKFFNEFRRVTDRLMKRRDDEP